MSTEHYSVTDLRSILDHFITITDPEQKVEAITKAHIELNILSRAITRETEARQWKEEALDRAHQRTASDQSTIRQWLETQVKDEEPITYASANLLLDAIGADQFTRSVRITVTLVAEQEVTLDDYPLPYGTDWTDLRDEIMDAAADNTDAYSWTVRYHDCYVHEVEGPDDDA